MKLLVELRKSVREIGEISFSLEMALWLPININSRKQFCFFKETMHSYIFKMGMGFLTHHSENMFYFFDDIKVFNVICGMPMPEFGRI